MALWKLDLQLPYHKQSSQYLRKLIGSRTEFINCEKIVSYFEQRKATKLEVSWPDILAGQQVTVNMANAKQATGTASNYLTQNGNIDCGLPAVTPGRSSCNTAELRNGTKGQGDKSFKIDSQQILSKNGSLPIGLGRT